MVETIGKPSPAAAGDLPRWHGDGLLARSIRFALTVMAPIAVGLVVGVDIWLIYAMLTCILGFTLDTGGPAAQRFVRIGAAGAVILLGTGLGTLVAHHTGLTILAFALAGALYALVESIDPSAAAASRFLCLTLAVGALYAPLQPADIPVVAGFAVWAWLVSLGWDLVVGLWRPSVAPAPRAVLVRIRDTARERWIFAGAVAISVPLALFTSLALGLHRPYWALIAIVLVLRADSLMSRQLMMQQLAGTLLGILAALGFGHLFPAHAALLTGMALAALLRWPAQQLNGTLGAAALTAFIILLLELVAGGIGGAAHDIAERLVDVAVGCGFAFVALELDRFGRRLFRRR